MRIAHERMAGQSARSAMAHTLARMRWGVAYIPPTRLLHKGGLWGGRVRIVFRYKMSIADY